MSDDISIPSPTYRVPRHARGMDPATRRLVLIATGIGGTLLAVAAGSAMLNHHSHGVPVIQADSSPMRVKPTNAGGLQVAGVNNDIFSGGSDTDVEKLAPPPQTPDPQALRAPPEPKPAPVPVARAPSAPAAQPRVEQTSASRVATPAIAPARTDARTPAKPETHTAADEQSAAAGKNAVVQLAALASEQEARAEWDRLAKRWPQLFDRHRPAFSKVTHDGQMFWRVRTGGFDGVTQATAFCQQLRAKGGSCSVADF